MVIKVRCSQINECECNASSKKNVQRFFSRLVQSDISFLG